MEIDKELSNFFRIKSTPLATTVTPIDKVDAILNYFYERKEKESIWYYNIPEQFEKPKRLDLTKKEIESICKKLNKEAYLDLEIKATNTGSNQKVEHYKINFDGELLWLDGSYNEKIKKEEEEKNRINNIEKKQLDLQYIIAFVGVASALYYSADLLLKGCLFIFWSFLSLTLISGILLWRSRQQKKKKP